MLEAKMKKASQIDVQLVQDSFKQELDKASLYFKNLLAKVESAFPMPVTEEQQGMLL